MSFYTPTTGDFTPFVKYSAKSGRWTLKDDVEVRDPVFVADMDSLKTGWFYFRDGIAPDKVYNKSLSEPVACPDKTYVDKDGKTKNCYLFGGELKIFSNAAFGGVVELTTTSALVLDSIKTLYLEYKESPEAASGKLPVVKFVEAVATKGAYGTNYKPVFKIEKWVPRPVELQTQTEQSAVSPAAISPAPAVQASSVSEF